MTLIKKEKLDGKQLKALVAYLNSTIPHLFIEFHGTPTGGGMMVLDKKSISQIPIMRVMLRVLTGNRFTKAL